MTATNEQQFYYPELDGLRFVAFMLVFIHNSLPILQQSFLKVISVYGWVGVDLFFCLSAFLITKLLTTEQQRNGKINIRSFYIRRVLRIWPLYFLYIALGLLLLDHLPGNNSSISMHVIGLATFTFNFVYISLLPSPIIIFVHLWSISFEEQFYVVIPWIVRHISTSIHKAQIAMFAFCTGFLIRAIFIYLRIEHPAIYYFPFTHFESIAGGVILGLGYLDQPLNTINKGLLFLLGLSSLLLIFLLPNNDVTSWALMLTYPLVGIGMTLIVFSVINAGHLVSELLKKPALVYLGKISYGLYIFHILSLFLAGSIAVKLLGISPEAFSSKYIIVLSIGLILSTTFAVISYSFFESPFLQLKRSFGVIRSGQ